MSEFSRETLLNIIETDHVQCGEASALARMALAAMDSSESVELPLDYLQGHKDGLEWAAQLAEANHPETGDWLYDDPIELAKAIRKGPDMPPAQPVADSEPDRNPVLAYADSYRDMAKQGVESVPIWSVITDLERNIAPLYRHAQPAPGYPEVLPCSVLLEPWLRFGKGIKTSTMLAALARRAVHESDMAALSPEERAEFQAGIEDFKALIAQPAPVVMDDTKLRELFDSWFASDCSFDLSPEASEADNIAWRESYWYVWQRCRAAMLERQLVDRVDEKSLTSINPAPDLVSLQKKAESIIGNYPGIPDCWCRTCRPVVLNDMRFVVCPDCGNKRCPRANDHRNACTGSNEPGQEGSAYPDATQLPGSEPATVPGKWIPVSERMPENDGAYLCWDNRYVTTYAFIFGAWQANQFIAKNITHWMPLPAGPQGVKGE